MVFRNGSFLLVSDNSPLPLTPDYGGSVVRYADGVFDPHFSRYITVMEGDWYSIYSMSMVLSTLF